MPDRRDGPVVGHAHSMIAVLRREQDRLAALVAGLGPGDLGRPSYDPGWSIAQVLSHMGSQGDIFGRFLAAGLDGRDVPGPEIFPPVWDEWNAKPPEQQAADGVAANEALVARLERLDDATLAAFDIMLFGRDTDAAGFARMRVSEIALHTWDVAVALDPAARVDPDAVAVLYLGAFELVRYAGRPGEWTGARPFRVQLHVTAPELASAAPGAGPVLTIADDAVLLGYPDATETAAAADADLTLPAEALVRLIAGRLDPAHTPTAEITATGVDLDALRPVFPGF